MNQTMGNSIFKPAQRERFKFSLLLSGIAGAGKTVGALRVAYGLAGCDWAKVFYIQTEPKDASVYRDLPEFGIGAFMHAKLTPPFAPERIEALMDIAESNGALVIVLDSFSLVWSGEGGTLDQKEKVTANSNAKGGGFNDWGIVNPAWYGLLKRLTTNQHCHIVATTRSKDAYEQYRDDNGRWKVERLGLAPELRPRTDYEFWAHVAIDQNTHQGIVLSQTGKPFVPDMPFEINHELGLAIADWSSEGNAPVMRFYGNGQPVDVLNDLHVYSYDYYLTHEGKTPYTFAALKGYYKANQPVIDQYISEKANPVTDSGDDSDVTLDQPVSPPVTQKANGKTTKQPKLKPIIHREDDFGNAPH